MNRLILNIFKAKWNAVLSVLIAFAFIFSASTFASAKADIVPMASMHSVDMEMHGGSDQATEMHDCSQSDDGDDCCDKGNDIPCSNDEGCKTVCTTMSLSPAVLTGVSPLNQVKNADNNVYYHSSIDGIAPHINAPPPRA